MGVDSRLQTAFSGQSLNYSFGHLRIGFNYLAPEFTAW